MLMYLTGTMRRKKFILSTLATIPLLAIAKIKSAVSMRTEKGFKVGSGEARFGTHYKMKGVTQNILDIKISGKDTENDLAVFEQTGLTPNGVRRYTSIHTRTNGFMLLRENIYSRLEKTNMK